MSFRDVEPKVIYDFLGERRSSPGPGLFNTYFADALWSQRFEDSHSSSGTSLSDPHSSEDMLPPPSPPSEGSHGTLDDASSAATPEPPLSSSPPFEEVRIDQSARAADLVDLRQGDDKFTTPTYITQQFLPRPTKLIIADKPKSRSRVVQDVDKTNQVRGTGACNRCRLGKVPCSVSGTCPACVKACPLAHEVCCVRKDITSTARESSSKRFSGLVRKEDNIVKDTLRRACPEFGNDLFEGQIFLDRNCSGLGLQACLRNYKCMGPGNQIAHSGCTFSKGHVQPALDQQYLVGLAGQSLSQEDLQTFEGAIESFIGFYIAPHHYGARQRPQFALLEKLRTFKAAYRICRSEKLWFLQKDKGVVELPLPAQAELRGVARSALDSSERDIHSELDKYLKTPKIPDQDKPVVWAALWQLMFVYRDLLRGVRPLHNSAEALFNAVAVFYATMFRTTAALKCLDSVQACWLPNDAQSCELAGAFSYALSLRDTFYQSIVAGVHAVDQSLKILVVDPEMKVLKRRPATARKSTGVKRGAAHVHDDEDETMGGC
ncbi:hypothetical protein CGLO_05369 [Colletotrichum gloeosporioides Cg-14]|uniref:Uncharacterized protein n=1 Tax=Colletotrichum gloeosporioides (strain Cg-14) TaxID=1237896 RepID=T0KRN6_COLGC|nr:hypothetical protein CGLO_05369 [Colletotrichum gloeosporioides Cg-14]